MGNFSNWGASTGLRTAAGMNVNTQTTGVDLNHHSVMNQGFDLNVGGGLLPTVAEGQHSFRIGNDDASDLSADRMWYTFNVTALNADFGFKFAMVLQDGNHDPLSLNPSFSWSIILGNSPDNLINTTTGLSNVITTDTYIADDGNPFFKKANNQIVYRDWSWACFDLTDYIGQTVTVSFVAMDCNLSGHYGYAYVDALCERNKPIADFKMDRFYCLNEPIIMDASITVNEDSYWISVQESNQWWTPIGTEYSEWFIAQQAGLIDLKAFLMAHGSQFECNKYYRVKLAASNGCTPWVDKTILINVYCPQMNIVDDITLCCNNELGPVTIGPITNLTNNFSTTWSINQGNTLSTIPSSSTVSISVPPISNATINYTITQFFDTGQKHVKVCSISDEVKINIIDDFTVEIVEVPIDDCCKKKLIPQIVFSNGCNNWETYSLSEQQAFLNNMNILWSNGSASSEIIVSGESQTYDVTVSLENCFSHSASYNYIQSPAYYGSAGYGDATHSLQANNALVSGSPNDNGKLIIIASTVDALGILWPPVGTHQGIYKAKSFRIRVWDRWGELIRTVEFEDCGALKQGDVFWDGRNNSGNLVNGGYYVFKLDYKICSQSWWQPYCGANDYTYLQPGDCIADLAWGHIPGASWWVFGWYCPSGSYSWNTGPGDCAYRVLVLD
jgi:hypothetical protein